MQSTEMKPCRVCGKMIASVGVSHCPHCGAEFPAMEAKDYECVHKINKLQAPALVISIIATIVIGIIAIVLGYC